MFPKRIALFLCICFIAVKVSAISYPDSILFKDYAKQYRFRFEMVDGDSRGRSPEEIEQVLRSYIQWARDKDDLKLYYGFKISLNKHLVNKQLADTSQIENQMIDLISALENDGLYDLKAEALQMLANYYWGKERRPESFQHHITAYKIYNKLALAEFPGKPFFLLDFGGRYYYYRDYTTAAHYILEGYRENPETKEGYLFTMLNTLSLCYLHNDILDSAEYYLAKVYNLAKKKNDTVWAGIVSGNLGALYFKKNDYDKALRYFREEIESAGGQPSLNVANTYSVLAEIYIAKGEKENALNYALQAYDVLKQKEGYSTRFDVNHRIYLGLAKAYAANGDMLKAYRFLDSGTVAKDSVEKKRNALILSGIRHKISANDRLLEQAEFEKNARNNRTIRNILIAVIIMVVIIAILLYNRQRMKHAFSQKQLESQKKHVETELETATLQLNALVESISERNDLIESFTAELARLREHVSDDKLSKADETLVQLQKTTIITDEEWEHFSKMFEKVNSGFLKRLNSKVKGLSPIETKFIMLSKLKLSTKEVAAALGISADSVRLNRKRLYDKLGLTEGEHSLHALIDDI